MEKKTIYSRNPGQEGSNIDIALLVYINKEVKISLAGYGTNGKFSDTLLVQEFNYQPVQNLVARKLIEKGIGTAGQPASAILESQSLSTLGMMILSGQMFLTSYNSEKKDIVASVGFETKIPLYIDATDSTISKLFKLVGYRKPIPTANSQDSLDNLIRENSQKMQNEQNSTTPERRKELEQNEERLRDDKRLIQFMVENKRSNKYLVGFLFVKKNELVINQNGYAKTMRVTLSDSLELRYRFGGRKISLKQYNIVKIQDYNFALDLRSVAASQRSLDAYIAIRKHLDKSAEGLEFWTHLTEVVQYDPPDDMNITELFVPKQVRIIFHADNPVVGMVKETDLNTVVKLNIFTDLVGIQEDQPNGLVQVEGTFKTQLFGWTGQKRYKLTRSYWIDHVEANLKFSKIENKLRFLDAGIIKGGSAVTFIPNFQLLQYSNLEAGIKVSVYKTDSYKRTFNLYGGLGMIRTGIRDTVFSVSPTLDTTKTPRTYNLLTFRKSLQAHFKIKATSNMGIDISLEAIWLKLLDKDVRQSGGNFSRDNNTFTEFNAKKNVLLSPQFQIYYLPNQDESKRIYLRTVFLHDIATRSNNYLNIQVGISSDLSKFLNFRKTD